jgi:hypothetical protein
MSTMFSSRFTCDETCSTIKSQIKQREQITLLVWLYDICRISGLATTRQKSHNKCEDLLSASAGQLLVLSGRRYHVTSGCGSPVTLQVSAIDFPSATMTSSLDHSLMICGGAVRHTKIHEVGSMHF